jgi:hypothetical protein
MHYGTITGGCLRRRSALLAVASCAAHAALLSPVAGLAAEPQPMLESLQRQLDERAALIQDLMRRLDALERQVGQSASAVPRQDQAPGKTRSRTARMRASSSRGVNGYGMQRAAQAPTAPGAKAPATRDASPGAATVPAPSGKQTAQAQNGGQAPETPKPQAPGQVTATEEEAERALERSLVATGVLLLPFGQVEVEPIASYVRREAHVPALFSINGDQVLAQQKVRRNEFQQSLSLRGGLPFDAQLEFNLPYTEVDQENVTNVQVATLSRSTTGWGLGDLSLGVAKTVLREKNWWPDLITRFTWTAPTGQFKSNDVVLGNDSNQLRGQVVALKRQDPLAFSAQVFYETTFERNGFELGDNLGLSGGLFLATSPETSLQLSLSQEFVQDSKLNGKKQKGSDQVASVLNLGFSSILTRNVLLQMVVGVGLTDDAPDYSVELSLPIRFSLPVD